MSSTVFAQMEGNAKQQETPKAIKLDEFERATNGYVKMKMDAFFADLSNSPAAQGYIINYGTKKEILKREKQLKIAITFRKYDAPGISFVRAGYIKVIKTVFWLVPPGAEPPTP